MTAKNSSRRTWRRPGLVAAGLLVLAVASRADWWTDDPNREADRMLALGRQAIVAQDWDKADEYADRLIAAEHRDHGRLLRGEALFHQNRPESALDALTRVNAEGLRVDAARTEGLCLLQIGNERAADRVLQSVVPHRPDDADVYRGLAAIAYNQGNWVHAEEYLRKVMALDPADGRPVWTLGMIYHDMATHAEAERLFRDALSRNLPGDLPGQVRAQLAASLAEQKRYSEALEELQRAELPILTPRQARLQVDCLRSTGRTSEALAQVDRFLARRPSDPELLAEKGLALLDSRRPSEAVRVLENALLLTPHDRRAREGLGRAYQALGQSAEAVEQQRKLAESDALYKLLNDLTLEAMQKPWDPAVRFKMAEACEKLHKPELAAMWRKAARVAEGS
jgi:Flp pilus assembly protein TadD